MPIFISGKLRRAWLYFISSALIFFKFWRFHSHSFDHVHHSSHDSQGLGLTFLQPLCVVSMITRGNQTSRTIIQLVGAFFFLISPYAEDCRQRRTHREPFVFAFLCILMAAAGLLTASCLQYSSRAVSRHHASIPDSIKSFPITNITYAGRPWFLLYFPDRDGSWINGLFSTCSNRGPVACWTACSSLCKSHYAAIRRAICFGAGFGLCLNLFLNMYRCLSESVIGGAITQHGTVGHGSGLRPSPMSLCIVCPCLISAWSPPQTNHSSSSSSS